MQLAYQQAQSTYNNTHTPYTNHTIPSHTSSHTSSVLYVADYTLFVKNTLEMTEKQLSTRKKTNEANTTSNITASTTTKKKKKSTPTITTTTTTADNNDSNNNIAVLLPTINSESPPTHTHTHTLIGADILSIPRIGTKAVAALLANIDSTTGRRIVEELLVEVTVRPYATTTGTTDIGKQQQQQQVNEVVAKGMTSASTDPNQLSPDTDPDMSSTTAPTGPSTSTKSSDNVSNTGSSSSNTGSSSGSIWSTTSDSNGNIITTVTSGNRHSNNRPFVGEVIVFTGKLESMSRAQAGALCERLGTG